MRLDRCVVYWLHDETCTHVQAHGYVGISRQFVTRLARHQRNKRFPAGFGWTILFTGTLVECLAMEHQLRPQEGVGWNRSRGGKPVIDFNDDVRANMRKPKRTRAQIVAERAAAQEARRSGEWNDRLRAASTGQPQSASKRQKCSEAHRGVPKSPEHRAAIAKAMTGKRLSAETRVKISLAKRKHTPGLRGD